jgi:uracil-DNA glycosylase
VLTLGNEAFNWFARYADRTDVSRARRLGPFAAELECRLCVRCGAREIDRVLTVCPLPHPSPANARYKTRFAEMLTRRLARCL